VNCCACLVFALVSTVDGLAQEFARPITLKKDTPFETMTVFYTENNTVSGFVGRNHAPSGGKAVKELHYLLLPDAFLPTEMEASGNMLYDGEVLPLDNVKVDGKKVSDFDKRKPLEEVPSLTASIELQRTVYKYVDAPQDARYESLKDSVIKSEDHVFLTVNRSKAVEGADHLNFALIIHDTILVKQPDFIVGQRVELADSLINQIGIDLEELVLTNGSVPISRLAVVARGHTYSFIKDYHREVIEDRSTPMPPIESEKWVWFVNGILTLLAALTVFLLRKKEGETIADNDMPPTPSVQKPAADAPQEGTDGLIPEEDIQAQFERYKEDAKNWQELTGSMGEDAPKSASEVIDIIKDLQDKIRSWKEQTECDSPDEAHDGIQGLLSTITALKADKDSLASKNKKLTTVVKNIQKDPRIYKGIEGFNALTTLIKDAETGTKIRDMMNSTPEEIDPNSSSGILVRKGRLFDNYVVKIDDEVFRREDAELEIQTAIDNSTTACQIKKGDFLDRTKNDVKLFLEEGKGWIEDSELKAFIELVVNPHEILVKSNRTNTGLYKLMHDLDAVIAPCAKDHTPVPLDSLGYNWLKERIKSIVEGYNDNLQVESTASTYGTPDYDLGDVKPVVGRVFKDASRYLKFCEYKNYWKNIADSLFTMLDGLQDHDDIHNTRTFMFYTSQFYSIASIMNELYGDESYPTTRPKINVGIFNSAVPPAPTSLGFPQLDDESLLRCKFEYKGERNEDQKVRYLKQFKPMPFIFLFSYFDDTILS